MPLVSWGGLSSKAAFVSLPRLPVADLLQRPDLSGAVGRSPLPPVCLRLRHRLSGRRAGQPLLYPENFDLAAWPPVVVLAARSDKSRKGKTQPLPADVAGVLRGYLNSRPPGQP